MATRAHTEFATQTLGIGTLSQIQI